MPKRRYGEIAGGASGAVLGTILADSPVTGYNVGVEAVRASRKISEMVKSYARKRVRTAKPKQPRSAVGKKSGAKKIMKEMVKFEKKNIKGDDLHSGLSGDVVVVHLGSKKRHRKLRGAPIKLLSQSSYLSSTTAGVQNIRMLSIKGTTNDWVDSTTDTSNGDVNYGGWFASDPYQKDTGSVNYTTGAVVLPSGITYTQQMTHVQDITSLMIYNASTISQYHEIYVIECIKNTTQDPVQIWQDGLQRQGMGLTGIVQPAPGGVGPNAPGYLTGGIVGTYPTESREFRKFYKVRKVKKVYLGAAATEEIKFVVKINTTMTQEYVGKLKDQGISYMKGTYFILDVCHAQPVLDVTDANRAVTYGPVEYLVCNSTTLHFRSVSTRKKNAVSYGISYVAAGASSSNSRQINVVDGNVTVNNL